MAASKKLPKKADIPKQSTNSKKLKTERGGSLHKNKHIFGSSPDKVQTKSRIKSTMAIRTVNETGDERDVERKGSVISRFSHIFGDAVTDGEIRGSNGLNKSVDRAIRK